jgi:putative ABC transport system permease protein
MNLLVLAWKNLTDKPSRFLFVVLMMAIAFSLMDLIVLVNKQFGNHFGRSSEKVDLVLGAKGSPLQSVLCNVMHIDAPTGNIPVSDIRPFLNPKHPIIASAIPMSLGDSYRSFRIVGTVREYFDHYNLVLAQGEMFQSNFQAVAGTEAAKEAGLVIGSEFSSDHGLVSESDGHTHEHSIKLTGILKPTGTIQDRLIFTNLSTYWLMHEEQAAPGENDTEKHDHAEHDHADHDHAEHDHAEHDHAEHDHAEHSGPENIPVNTRTELTRQNKEITSVLLTFKGKNIQALNFGRQINENTNLMAVNPAIEINRLYELAGSASEILYLIGIILAILTILALFINLMQVLEDRQKEIALLRLSGANRIFSVLLLVTEVVYILIIGLGLGFLISHGFLHWASTNLDLGDKYEIRGLFFCVEEIQMAGIALLSGLLASLYPAWLAYRQDISKVLMS